jgi:hypothetical protein
MNSLENISMQIMVYCSKRLEIEEQFQLKHDLASSFQVVLMYRTQLLLDLKKNFDQRATEKLSAYGLSSKGKPQPNSSLQ